VGAAQLAAGIKTANVLLVFGGSSQILASLNEVDRDYGAIYMREITNPLTLEYINDSLSLESEVESLSLE